MQKFETLINRIILILAGIPLLFLTVCSLVTTGLDYEGAEEGTILVRDNWGRNIGLLLLLFLVLYVLVRFLRNIRNLTFVAGVESICMCIVSALWVIISKTKPTGDQFLVWEYAKCINQYEYFPLKWGGYLVYYQNQLGLVTVERIFWKLFDWMEYPYMSFQLFNAWMVAVLVFSGYTICRHLSRGSKMASVIYLILMPLFIPLYIYVPYVYGEIPSAALLMLGAALLLDVINGAGIFGSIICAVSVALAVLFRTNAWVMVLAMAGVLVILILKEAGELLVARRRGEKANERKAIRNNLSKLILTLFMILGITYGVNNVLIPRYYEKFMEQEHDSIPGIVLVAMGTNDEGVSPGWHNNYDVDTYFEAQCHADVASQIAWEKIDGFVEKCKADPGYAMDFYYRKITSQWNTPFYGCFRMNSLFREEPEGFVHEAYFGKWNERFAFMSNLFQLFVFVMCFLGVFVFWKKKTPIWKLLPLIFIYGGFLLSILWEAKSRYVLPYVIMMIPVAAVVAGKLYLAMENRIKKKR